MLKGGFAFLGPDRVIAQNKSNPAKSAIFSFPAGEVIQSVQLGLQDLDATTQGNYVLLRPVVDAMVGVLDLKVNKGVMALTQSAAIDVFDQQFIAQGLTGEVGLFDLGTMNPLAKAELPGSPLGALRAQAVSSDFHWLALSGNTRGAIWDLANMRRLYYTHGFRGAFFDGTTGFYADFPKYAQSGRTIARVDLPGKTLAAGVPLDDDSPVRQYGPYLVSRKPNRKDKNVLQDVTLEVQDVRDGKSLWTTSFPKAAPLSITAIPDENRTILLWDAQLGPAREEIKKHDALEKQFSAMRDHTGVFLTVVLETGTGHFLGGALVNTGQYSFHLENAYAAGDWLLIADNENRTLIYSISNGELKGFVFGQRSILSSAAGYIATENGAGQLQIYGLPGLEKGSRLSFSSPIAMDRFSADGKRLFVLTSDQHFYLFDTSLLAQPGTPNTGAP
jgi:hypothetical protein